MATAVPDEILTIYWSAAWLPSSVQASQRAALLAVMEQALRGLGYELRLAEKLPAPEPPPFSRDLGICGLWADHWQELGSVLSAELPGPDGATWQVFTHGFVRWTDAGGEVIRAP